MTGLHSYRIGIILAVIAGIMAISAISCRSGDKQQIESYNSYNLGVKAVKANNLDLAGNYFKKAVILNPDFTEARLNLANIDFLKGNLDKARDEYTKLLEEKQYDPRLLFNLGWIYLKQENYETAAELFRKSRRVDPSFTDSDYGLAMLAHAQNEDALTKFHLQNYIANSADGRWSKKANEVLNSLASDEGIIEETEISTTETTDSQPVEIPKITPAEIVQPVKETPVEEKKPDIIKTPDKEVKKKTVAPKPKKTTSQLLNEGNASLKKGEYSTAENRLKQALRQDKKSIEAAKSLAKLYYAKGSNSLEEKYIKEYVRLSGGDEKDGFEIAGAYENIGDLYKAIDYYRNYLTNNPFGSNAAKAKEKLTELDSEISD